jgi:hypothetical protein
MDNALTIRDVAIMTGLHRNTIRNYVKAGRLKATLIDEGTGRQRYVIDREALYNCGIPKVLSHLGPLEVQERLNKSQAEYTDDTFGELIRLNRELLAAREELSGLRVQVPMLQAAQVERDSLREADVEGRQGAKRLTSRLYLFFLNVAWSGESRTQSDKANTLQGARGGSDLRWEWVQLYPHSTGRERGICEGELSLGMSTIVDTFAASIS